MGSAHHSTSRQLIQPAHAIEPNCMAAKHRQEPAPPPLSTEPSAETSRSRITTDLEAELARIDETTGLRARRTHGPTLGHSGRGHLPALAFSVSAAAGRSPTRLCVMDIVEDGELSDLNTLSQLADRRDDLGAARAALVSRRGFPVDVMKGAGFLAIDLVIYDDPKPSRPRLETETTSTSRAFDYFRVNGRESLEPFRLDQWLRDALAFSRHDATATGNVS